MSDHVIEVSRRATVAPTTVFSLVADEATYPAWSPIDEAVLEQPDAAGGGGVGAVRRFRTGRIVSREQVVEVDAPRRLVYTLLSGLPLRDYRATVTVEPVDGGSVVTWRSTFRAKVPLTGRLYRRQLAKFLDQMVEGLVAAAEARSPAI